MFRNTQPRWVEWIKLFLAIIPFPEISAARSMAMVARLAPGEELRTGFTMQMVDEFRHSTIQMNLKKWYTENYIDPAGFDVTESAFGKCSATTIGALLVVLRRARGVPVSSSLARAADAYPASNGFSTESPLAQASGA